MSNIDRIKKLDTWEFAEFLKNVSENVIRITVCEEKCDSCEAIDDWCVFQIAEWLLEESE